MSNLKNIPNFKNEDEERNFWTDHDSTKYMDWRKSKTAQFPNLNRSGRNNGRQADIKPVGKEQE